MGDIRANRRLFFREFRRSFHTTGAILPSGPALGRALTRFIRERTGPHRILEVGPGTGAVTQYIVDAMGPSDGLDLVEINGSFVDHLRDRFEREADFAARAAQVRVLKQNIVDWQTDGTYDRIVSGLPLNNFSVDDVDQILAAIGRLAHRGTIFSFFEYMAVRTTRSLVSGRRDRERLWGIGQSIDRFLAGREIRRDSVWPNLPPAWVHHVRFETRGRGEPGAGRT